jgi:chorismate dehydratase
MSVVRLGAVEYLNARPLVFGLEQAPRFALRFDVPSRCAALLHEGGIDAGLIPSVEYLRGPGEAGRQGDSGYRIVPGLAISSRGRVASVTLYTTRAIADVRSIAMDTSSRTSVALARVMCARAFGIQPEILAQRPDLHAMLTVADAALIIGDNALLLNEHTAAGGRLKADATLIEKIDLGEVWTRMTGLPFVYAFWAGRPGALTPDDVIALQQARDEGVQHTDAIVGDYFRGNPDRQAVGVRYLRDNIKYDFGPDERAGLELFYRYAAEAGIVEAPGPLRFY